ncbi:SIMPL domain-containing protein [Undibacterium terreum]|uniref:Oxidative stress defense protein n=1 Tax=Undibacterium terreum TaxID=1224302 RepID=A0A916XEL9_9BURK|nr:SIMPL domain-containing protein [Undibacterium terreum]GGC64767.1 hypothetical protein GCM10011396_09720 [Undibacterium terreum]
MLKKIVFIVFSFCFYVPGFASQLPDYPFIHAIGMAYVSVTPDKGELAFDVKASDADAEAALALAVERLAEVRSLLAQQGIPDADISIRDLRKEIKKDAANPNSGGQVVELSYGAYVKIRDLTKWQAIISALLKLNNIDKVEASFDSTTRDKIELDLSIEAAKDAQRKATGMVSAYGKHLGAVTAMSEGKLKSLSSAIGLVSESSSSHAEIERRQAVGIDLFVIPPLKLQASIDVIFKIK